MGISVQGVTVAVGLCVPCVPGGGFGGGCLCGFAFGFELFPWGGGGVVLCFLHRNLMIV